MLRRRKNNKIFASQKPNIFHLVKMGTLSDEIGKYSSTKLSDYSPKIFFLDFFKREHFSSAKTRSNGRSERERRTSGGSGGKLGCWQLNWFVERSGEFAVLTRRDPWKLQSLLVPQSEDRRRAEWEVVGVDSKEEVGDVK
jgi:hypothetical protein